MPWLCGMRIPTYVGVHVACSMRVDECQQKRKFRCLPSADWSDFMLTQVSHVLRVQHLRPAPLPRCFRTPGVLRLGLHCLGAWSQEEQVCWRGKAPGTRHADIRSVLQELRSEELENLQAVVEL